jgi:hypothetical protein
MAAGIYNFSLDQGAKHVFEIEYVDADGNAKNITNFGLRGHIRRKINDCDILAEFDFEVIDASQGRVKVTLDANKFVGEMIKANSFKDVLVAQYDIELYSLSESDDIRRLLNGSIRISPEVTR